MGSSSKLVLHLCSYEDSFIITLIFNYNHQDIRQSMSLSISSFHFQVIKTENRAEDRYEEKAHSPNEEGQYVF